MAFQFEKVSWYLTSFVYTCHVYIDVGYPKWQQGVFLFITPFVSATAAAGSQLHTQSLSDRIACVVMLRHIKIAKCSQMLLQIWIEVSFQF